MLRVLRCKEVGRLPDQYDDRYGALPLQYLLAVHDLHHLPEVSGQHCPYEALIGAGDGRMPLVRIDESVPVRTPRRPRPWVAATRRVLADRLD